MRKWLTVAFIIAVLLAGGWWYFTGGRFDVAAPLSAIQQGLNATMQQVMDGNVSAPPPLRAKTDAPSARLTREGVRTWTNAERKKTGAAALTFDAALDAAAETKLKDLFAKQYFEHVSPEGIGPAQLAGQAGYLYIMVGENLALGNFKDDQELVQAWMDSPGHRANILEPRYQEIGIAVGQGIYEGRKTWIAVQEFGRPQSACAKPDTALAAKIQTDRTELDHLTAQAEQQKADIQATRKPRTQDEADAYNAKVDAYNALVKRIDALIAQLQGEITAYNGGVTAYNACVSG